MVFGLLPLYKLPGPSSAALVNTVKHITHIKRVGHSGTLDPAAAGMMVLAFNQATRLLPYLPDEKTYRARICLGITTDTLDQKGVVLEKKTVPDFTPDQLAQAVARFQGSQSQIPPMVSALHFNGKRLYRLARSGQTVDVPARLINILSIRLLGVALPELEVEVTCSGGTYIRTLAADLGKALGCGAHLAALERTACNGFQASQALALDAFIQQVRDGQWEKNLIDPAKALAHLPEWSVSRAEVQRVLHGHALSLPQDFCQTQDQPVRIFDPQRRMLAMARCQGQSLVMERVLVSPDQELP